MSQFTDELNAEIDRRIAVMENPEYETVPQFSGRDFIPPAAIFIIVLVLIIISYAGA